MTDPSQASSQEPTPQSTQDTQDTFVWQTKLAARIHDPAEKALVLLRDPEGHEGGTSRVLRRLLGLRGDTAAAGAGIDHSSNDTTDHTIDHTIDHDNDDVLARVIYQNGLPQKVYRHVQRADWWAAAADRPQWPMREITITTKKGEQKTLAVASWARVNWANQPVLKHPLTGAEYDLGKHGDQQLTDTEIDKLKATSFDHFFKLLQTVRGKSSDAGQADDGQQNDIAWENVTSDEWCNILLAFWRFGSELTSDSDQAELGAFLWGLLPADTRIPDHSIWDHLDLTSAFAGAFAADATKTDGQGEVSLLSLSIGPVQGFISAARSTSDLWAGSHLLARLSWECMRPICEALGPDAILFPRLRGVPQVDLWLQNEMGLPEKLFQKCEWKKGNTDANPLFSAALPNRFVAVVPAGQAQALAEQATQAVRDWLQGMGKETVNRLLEEAGIERDENLYCYQQMREQLQGFPEVHWAVVPFSLIGVGDAAKQRDLNTTQLSKAMRPFFDGSAEGDESSKEYGFLASPAWQVLQKEMQWEDNTTFFAPNPGVLYPAVHDLAERVLAAAKATRSFDQQLQQGWRCSLTGEVEWLTTDKKQLSIPPGERAKAQTLWSTIHNNKPSWAKAGEHLGALSAIKRLWPTLFVEDVKEATDTQDTMQRFVVSTHTMALAHQLNHWLETNGENAARLPDELENALELYTPASVALPRKMMNQYRDNPNIDYAKILPGLLEALKEQDDVDTAQADADGVRRALGELFEGVKPETYYAILRMDGDRMGAWLTGGEDYAISYAESFHPKVQKGFQQHAQNISALKEYGEQKRAVSPNRHLSISAALNDFSLHVVRHVVEQEHLGKVIYAGGDDVLAMLPVADVLPCMQRLRHAYSGHVPEKDGKRFTDGYAKYGLSLNNGFAMLKYGSQHRLMRMMGSRATASTGIVIAHHQAPLAAVLRESHAAEQRAKNKGGRDAFSITVVKRGGGALYLTAKWGEPVQLLTDMRDFLRQSEVSRRAVYHTSRWIHDLPVPDSAANQELLQSMLAYQLARQSGGADKHLNSAGLAKRLVAVTLEQVAEPSERLPWLENFLFTAEFLARETRSAPIYGKNNTAETTESTETTETTDNTADNAAPQGGTA